MPKKTHGLARGLDSLLPEVDMMTSGGGQEIAIGDIDPNPDQPRRAFSEESIAQLAQSIREQGLLQPILVVPMNGGRYRIVAGERGVVRVPEPSRNNHREQQRTKDARPCLLQQKHHALDRDGPGTARGFLGEDPPGRAVNRTLEAGEFLLGHLCASLGHLTRQSTLCRIRQADRVLW